MILIAAVIAAALGISACGYGEEGLAVKQDSSDYNGAVLFAIQNGGFSGAIMPQNIVVGPQALAVAQFVATYAGRSAPKIPGVVPCQQVPIGSISAALAGSSAPTGSPGTVTGNSTSTSPASP